MKSRFVLALFTLSLFALFSCRGPQKAITQTPTKEEIAPWLPEEGLLTSRNFKQPMSFRTVVRSADFMAIKVDDARYWMDFTNDGLKGRIIHQSYIPDTSATGLKAFLAQDLEISWHKSTTFDGFCTFGENSLNQGHPSYNMPATVEVLECLKLTEGTPWDKLGAFSLSGPMFWIDAVCMSSDVYGVIYYHKLSTTYGDLFPESLMGSLHVKEDHVAITLEDGTVHEVTDLEWKQGILTGKSEGQLFLMHFN